MAPRTLVAARIEPELIAAVDRRAAADGVTRSEVLREAARRYTADEDPPT